MNLKNQHFSKMKELIGLSFILLCYNACFLNEDNSDNGFVTNVEYFDNGMIKKEILWDTINDVKSIKAFHPNGVLSEKITMKEDKPNGTHFLFYPNGNMKLESNFLFGNLDRDYRVFFDDGTLREVGFFRRGERVGDSFFYDTKCRLSKYAYHVNGNLTFQKVYKYNSQNEISDILVSHDLYTEIPDTVKAREPFLIKSELTKIDSSICKDFRVYFDYIDEYTYERTNALPFPRHHESYFDKKKAKEVFSMKLQDTGKYFIYGFLKYKDKLTDEEETTQFTDSVYVVRNISI